MLDLQGANEIPVKFLPTPDKEIALALDAVADKAAAKGEQYFGMMIKMYAAMYSSGELQKMMKQQQALFASLGLIDEDEEEAADEEENLDDMFPTVIGEDDV